MRKILLFLALSLVVSFSANSADYNLKRSVIGSGGFVGSVSGEYKASGIIGQLVIGKSSGTSVTGDAYKVYSGFWVPSSEDMKSINTDNLSSRGQITNYPNPANSSTTFRFSLDSPAYVTLRVFDVMGNAITTVLEGYLESGEHRIAWNLRTSLGEEIASGSYLYELLVNRNASADGVSEGNYSLKNVVKITK